MHLVARAAQHAVDDERALDLRGHHPGHEVHALEHERQALAHRPQDRGLDADEHVARLVEEAEQRRVARVGVGERLSRLEARVVHRGHELLREERADRLADEVRGRDARDPEAVRRLRRDGRLPGAGRAADEQDDRELERLQLGEPAELPHRAAAGLLTEHLDRELLEPLELDRTLVPVREVELDPARERVGARAGFVFRGAWIRSRIWRSSSGHWWPAQAALGGCVRVAPAACTRERAARHRHASRG